MLRDPLMAQSSAKSSTYFLAVVAELSLLDTRGSPAESLTTTRAAWKAVDLFVAVGVRVCGATGELVGVWWEGIEGIVRFPIRRASNFHVKSAEQLARHSPRIINPIYCFPPARLPARPPARPPLSQRTSCKSPGPSGAHQAASAMSFGILQLITLIRLISGAALSLEIVVV